VSFGIDIKGGRTADEKGLAVVCSHPQSHSWFPRGVKRKKATSRVKRFKKKKKKMSGEKKNLPSGRDAWSEGEKGRTNQSGKENMGEANFDLPQKGKRSARRVKKK